MVYSDDEIKRHLKKERSRGRKHPGPDPDIIAERTTREKAIGMLLQLTNEDEFLSEFRRFMIDSGLRVGPSEIRRARSLWRARH